MIDIQTAYDFWDYMWWGIGRFFLWAFIIIIVLLFIVLVFEHVLAPVGEAIRSAWWRWTKRCPSCEAALKRTSICSCCDQCNSSPFTCVTKQEGE